MIKKLVFLIKNIVCSVIVIYGLNMVLNKIGYFIPINIITVAVTNMFGFFGLIGITVIYTFLL